MALMYVAVAVGGALGSVLRYILSQLAAQTLGTTFPYGTWVVNAVGSLRIGFLAVGLTRCAKNPVVAALLITGFLGGFTTFSSFMNETMQYMMAGLWKQALGYLAPSADMWAGYGVSGNSGCQELILRW
ncbi:fluoride efflux transporter CrcB [Allisonella histaminiformans]|uniref:fluoride efflux transporter CrcB n=1 Tax=Allisonella histaminiformans TaxID=209880 RepID=UPI002E78DF59|nr:fluoride efflux transporter CrcB [Allisonella histaminiformans]